MGNVDTLNINPQNINRNIVQPTSIHISQEEAAVINKLVHNLVEIDEKAGKIKTAEDRKNAFGKYWGKLQKKFKVTSYLLIPSDKYLEVETWLRQQVAMSRPSLRRTNKDEWRKEYYKSIYARAKQLGIEKEEILNIAFTKFDLDKPIDSLTKLNDKNLKKLYQIIFTK